MIELSSSYEVQWTPFISTHYELRIQIFSHCSSYENLPQKKLLAIIRYTEAAFVDCLMFIWDLAYNYIAVGFSSGVHACIAIKN